MRVGAKTVDYSGKVGTLFQCIGVAGVCVVPVTAKHNGMAL